MGQADAGVQDTSPWAVVSELGNQGTLRSGQPDASRALQTVPLPASSRVRRPRGKIARTAGGTLPGAELGGVALEFSTSWSDWSALVKGDFDRWGGEGGCLRNRCPAASLPSSS